MVVWIDFGCSASENAQAPAPMRPSRERTSARLSTDEVGAVRRTRGSEETVDFTMRACSPTDGRPAPAS